MLARKYLVPLKKEFPRIRKEGKIYDSVSFGLVVAYGLPVGGGPRAAFIVSKKIDRRSVVRHEVKRKLAEGVSLFLPRMTNRVEVVFLAKRRAVESSKEELGKEVEVVLRRARLL